MSLGSSVDELATDGRVTAEALDDRSLEDGVPLEHLYVAAAVVADVEVAREHEVAFEVCAGGCQGWGAVDVIEHLLDAQRERLDDSAPAFDVVPRRCLDKCEAAPAVIAVSEHGRAVITQATPDSLDDAIVELLEN